MAKSSQLSILGGLAAAIGASACCAGPLVLLLLGISGSWISHLTLLDPYRPIFIFVVVVLFGFAGWKIHQPVENCADDEACAVPKGKNTTKSSILVYHTVGVCFCYQQLLDHMGRVGATT